MSRAEATSVGGRPTLEETSDATFGCFSYFYPELEVQLVKAKLSPFNNNCWRPFNFTPKAGEPTLLPSGTAYTELLPPLSTLTDVLPAESKKDNYESGVAEQCPVPRCLGLHAPQATARACDPCTAVRHGA